MRKVINELMIGFCFLLCAMSTASAGDITRNTFDRNTQIPGGASENRNPGYEAWVGERLGRCLVDKCMVIIGTLQQAVRPEGGAESLNPLDLSYSGVTLTVDEWLIGEPQHWKPELELDKVPVKMGAVYGSESRGYVWQNVDFKVGGKLLVVFYPNNPGDQQSLTRVDKYGLVVSDARLFPSIRNIVAKHILYQTNADEILDAPKLLNQQTDNIFSGYLVSYLRVSHLRVMEGYDHADADVIVLSQLIGNKRFSEAGWFLFEASLLRTMLNADFPVSEATSGKVTETLVNAGCSDNLAMAKSAIRVLAKLTGANQVDLKPFLTETRRQKLLNNYKASQNLIDVQSQATFESLINPGREKLR
jgi:hypothetical protein